MVWTKIEGGPHRVWTAWDGEHLVVLEHDPKWSRTWVASATGGVVGVGRDTPREALDAIGCDLRAPDVGPDTNPRTSAGDAVDSERDDRPVMAWWFLRDFRAYVSPVTGEAHRLSLADPHPTALAKAMGWRAVEVPRG